jgi:hypothetical protein
MRTRLLLYDDDEREWLVHDGVVRHGEFEILPLGSPRADFRVFDRVEPRERRIYSFQREQPHTLDEALLGRQFIDASLVITARPPEREAGDEAR